MKRTLSIGLFQLVIIVTYSIKSYCQISNGSKPKYFNGMEKNIVTHCLYKKEILFEELDIEKIKKIDSLDEIDKIPFEIGVPCKTTISMENAGEWFTLENGAKIWKLEIIVKGAKSINLLYDKFWLADGATLHIYNEQKKHFIGGFTSRNNKGTKEKPGKFATSLVHGDKITLEYYQPENTKENSIISISKVIKGVKYKNQIELSTQANTNASCSYNINCPEGANWQDEKTGVALIFVAGLPRCSGSLIKNVKNDNTLYFLTAKHCLGGLDPETNPDASDWVFYWNYESSNCDNTDNFTSPSTTGATLIAKDPGNSDFALLKLTESPYELSPPIRAYFNGWDRQALIGNQTTVGIHHPNGEFKKIAISDTLGGIGSATIEVFFQQSHLYGGSSGSPLFNSNSRIIGQAWVAGPTTNCSSKQYTRYGIFSASWNTFSSKFKSLKSWLDPDNSNVNFLDGGYCNGRTIINTNYSYNENIINNCELTFQNVQIMNGAKVSAKAPLGTTLNGNFEVQLGSEFEIK